MSDNPKDAVQQEEAFNFVTDTIENPEDETMYDVGYIESETESEPETETTEESQEVSEESQEESPEEVQEETPIKDIPHKEDPSRFEYWQSKFSQEQNARKELEEKFQSLQEKLERPNTPEPEPLKPPVKPNSDDPLDKIDYLEKLAEYNQQIVDQQRQAFEQQQKAIEQQQQQAQFKAYMLGEYQKSGADEKLSAEAFNFFSSENSLDPSTQMEMYRAWKDVQGSQPNQKVEQIKARVQKQKTPLPPGVGGGNTETPKEPNFGEDLVDYYKKNKHF